MKIRLRDHSLCIKLKTGDNERVCIEVQIMVVNKNRQVVPMVVRVWLVAGSFRVRNPWGKILRENLAANPCGNILHENLAGNAVGNALGNLVANLAEKVLMVCNGSENGKKPPR